MKQTLSHPEHQFIFAHFCYLINVYCHVRF